MVKFKHNVRIRTWTGDLSFILTKLLTIDRNWRTLEQEFPGLPPDFVVTSIEDGVHSTNSKHYIGKAIDLRSKTFTSRQAKRDFRWEFERFLGPRYRVLLEQEGQANEHFHVQVKKGLI